MGTECNPFPHQGDRYAIWDMLMRRDFEAFVSQDWSLVARDFEVEGFFGIDAGRSPDPDAWTLAFPTLESYRGEWLRQAREAAGTAYAEPLLRALYRVSELIDIDLTGDFALARKKFDGVVAKTDGNFALLNWQTHYICRKAADRWKIASFIGYMQHR